MSFFNRKLVVKFGQLGATGRQINEKYRVSFSVEMTHSQSTNFAQVDIYGLGESTREIVSKDGSVLFLEAGYKNSSELLFSGSVTRTEIKNSPPHIITSIEAADGAFLLQDIKVNLAFVENTPLSAVVSAVSAQMGIPVIFGSPVSGVYQQGIALSATAKEALNTLSKKGNFRWSIQNGQLQITKDGTPVPGRAIVLNKSTGLLRSPQKIEDESRLGFNVVSLLQPRLVPNSLVVLDEGTFVVEQVTHRGDTYGQTWESEAEVFSLG
jgi:hypothetical protein